MAITFVGEKDKHGNDMVGFNIQMFRGIQPFILEFYLPCIAIVLVSQISFVIPLTALPGRVALLVTQFLTLTNLFIHAMVKIKKTFQFSKQIVVGTLIIVLIIETSIYVCIYIYILRQLGLDTRLS